MMVYDKWWNVKSVNTFRWLELDKFLVRGYFFFIVIRFNSKRARVLTAKYFRNFEKVALDVLVALEANPSTSFEHIRIYRFDLFTDSS